MGIIRTLFRLLIIITGVSLLVSIPFLIDYYGRHKIVKLLKEELPNVGLEFDELNANSVSYAFPIGLSLNGLSAELNHQERNLKPIKISLSADSISIRILLSELVLKGRIPIQLDIRGLIVQDLVNEIVKDDKSMPLVLGALEHHRLVLENVSLAEFCNSSVILNIYDDRLPFYKCLLQNWRSNLKLERVFLEILSGSENFIVPIKEVEEESFLIGELELSELSKSFVTQLTPAEAAFIYSSPTYGLKLLKLRRQSEKKAVQLFSDDKQHIDKFTTAYYHYQITNQIGSIASQAINAPQTLPPWDDSDSDQSLKSESDSEDVNFLVLLGRISSERNVPMEKFEDKQFFLDLMSEAP